jgi:hypothetical protein
MAAISASSSRSWAANGGRVSAGGEGSDGPAMITVEKRSS